MAAKFDHKSSMKKFQLAKPDIAKFVKNGDFEYEVLLMDEAQDMNLAMLDICLNQVTQDYALILQIVFQDKPKIVVGDPHQQIYSFNGAVNSMKICTQLILFEGERTVPSGGAQ